jgi:hypothetical protein
MHHLFKKANITSSLFKTSDIPFIHSRFIDKTTKAEHLFTNNQSCNPLPPPLLHSYIGKSSGRFIRGNIESKSNTNNNNNNKLKKEEKEKNKWNFHRRNQKER